MNPALDPTPVYLYLAPSVRGNPGPGGWGAVLVRDHAVAELSGPVPEQSTVQHVGFHGILAALRYLRRPSRIELRVADAAIVARLDRSDHDPWQVESLELALTPSSAQIEQWQRHAQQHPADPTTLERRLFLWTLDHRSGVLLLHTRLLLQQAGHELRAQQESITASPHAQRAKALATQATQQATDIWQRCASPLAAISTAAADAPIPVATPAPPAASDPFVLT